MVTVATTATPELRCIFCLRGCDTIQLCMFVLVVCAWLYVFVCGAPYLGNSLLDEGLKFAHFWRIK